MYYYIINPSAGRGAINSIQDKLKDRLKELGIDGEFAKTIGPGDATKMARAAIEKGHNTIVAVGGDGTVNEVINGVTKDNIAVGIIPIGNSNLLANHLGIKTWQQACEVLAARRLVGYGLIAAGQKYFLSTLTLGFGTELDQQNEGDAKNNLRNKVVKLTRSWRQAKEFEPLRCKIQVDNKYELESPFFSLSVANQKFENPLAENKLVITIAEKPSRLVLTGYVWGALKNQSSHPNIATSRIKADRIIIETSPATGLMIDGKLTGHTPIAIRLTDRRIRFITEKQTTGFKP